MSVERQLLAQGASALEAAAVVAALEQLRAELARPAGGPIAGGHWQRIARLEGARYESGERRLAFSSIAAWPPSRSAREAPSPTQRSTRTSPDM